MSAIIKKYRTARACLIRLCPASKSLRERVCIICLSIYRSIYLSMYIYLSIYLSIYPSMSIYLSYLSYLSIYLSIYLSLSLFMHICRGVVVCDRLEVPNGPRVINPPLPRQQIASGASLYHLSIYLSIYLCLSIYLSIYLSTHLSISFYIDMYIYAEVSLPAIVWR